MDEFPSHLGHGKLKLRLVSVELGGCSAAKRPNFFEIFACFMEILYYFEHFREHLRD